MTGAGNGNRKSRFVGGPLDRQYLDPVQIEVIGWYGPVYIDREDEKSLTTHDLLCVPALPVCVALWRGQERRLLRD